MCIVLFGIKSIGITIACLFSSDVYIFAHGICFSLGCEHNVDSVTMSKCKLLALIFHYTYMVTRCNQLLWFDNLVHVPNNYSAQN